MSDKAAFVSSVSLTQTSNVNVISPSFKRLLLAESEFASLISQILNINNMCSCVAQW